MLERLRGAASASEPRTQKAIYELGFSVMNPILVLLEVYKHEVAFTFIFLTCFNILDVIISHTFGEHFSYDPIVISIF